MEILVYILGWVVCVALLGFTYKNVDKIGDEDSSGIEWLAVIISGILGMVVFILMIAYSGIWLLNHINL